MRGAKSIRIGVKVPSLSSSHGFLLPTEDVFLCSALPLPLCTVLKTLAVAPVRTSEAAACEKGASLTMGESLHAM